MYVKEVLVRKLVIEDVEGLDAINVFLEDFGEDAGRVTITCYGETWTRDWCRTGTPTISDFIVMVEPDYIIQKFSPNLDKTLRDEDDYSIADSMFREIIKRRRSGDISRNDARCLWEDVQEAIAEGGIPDNSILYPSVFGEGWWEKLPRIENESYTYLKKIVKTVQKALREIKEKGDVRV